jgi:vacuolar-type H+-ATPase subunit I/STV1
MSPSDDNDEGLYSSSCESLSGDDGANNLQSQSSVEDLEDDNVADDTGSQVTFNTMDLADTDFLTPGGLNSFAVMVLLEKREKLLLKDLPKTIKPSGLSKKNFMVTVEAFNTRIEQLRMTASTENNSARTIHDIARNAIKHGLKLMDNVAKKMAKLEDDLSKSKSKLLDVSEKLRVAIFDQDAATDKVKTTSNSLKANKKELAKVKKELADVQEELANAKKEVESATSRNTSGSTSRHAMRGDSMECLCEKERIKLQAFKEKE